MTCDFAGTSLTPAPHADAETLRHHWMDYMGHWLRALPSVTGLNREDTGGEDPAQPTVKPAVPSD